MKYFTTIATLACAACTFAAPAADISTLEARQASSNNDVVDNTGCKKVTLIFARGTGEQATMGYVVGPGLASNLKTATGSAAIQGVDYPADYAGNANQGASGGPKMASLAAQAIKQCPDTKVIVAGYSQGAMVVHNALGQSALPKGKIAAVAAFGDPMNGQGFTGIVTANVVRYCGTSDSVCNGSGTTNTNGGHTDYGNNVKEAAARLSTIVGVKA